ncbi:MAG TPA: sialidase family protein [Gaiellaceae bacterium]
MPARLVALAVVAAALVAGAARADPPREIDVSRAIGIQAEVAVVADPTNPQVLFAASNSIRGHTKSLMLTYTSLDGGQTWTTRLAPTVSPGAKRCAVGDPAPAIAPDGTEYLGFLTADCGSLFASLEPTNGLPLISLAVATRHGPDGPWTMHTVAPIRGVRFDDKPALSVAPDGRLYAVWTRFRPAAPLPTWGIVVSHSDDEGATWSPPAKVSAGAVGVTFGQVAVDPSGTVFVSWVDTKTRVLVARGDGERFAPPVVVDTTVAIPRAVGNCGDGGTALPAQPKRCVTPAPTLALDARPDVNERLYLSYSSPGEDASHETVKVASFDASLHPLAVTTVAPAPGYVDRFLPTSALDRLGRLWECFYDTGADRKDVTTRYTCTVSADGGATWATPVPAASVASNETQPPASDFEYGDYEGLVVGADLVAHPMWTDSRDLRTRREEIYTASLDPALFGLDG